MYFFSCIHNFAKWQPYRFHIFFHQLDNFDTDYFLWATAHGLDAAHEPKERRDPKNPVPKALQEEEGDDDPEGGEG